MCIRDRFERVQNDLDICGRRSRADRPLMPAVYELLQERVETAHRLGLGRIQFAVVRFFACGVVRNKLVAYGAAQEARQDFGIGPVSYTHLDVYKRQVWRGFQRLL